jgi:hypothetical protein
MGDNRNDILAHDELLQLKLGTTPEGVLCVVLPKGFVPIGQCEPRYAYLLRSAATQYQTIDCLRRMITAMLEEAESKGDDAAGAVLQRITALVDLTQRFSRNEA